MKSDLRILIILAVFFSFSLSVMGQRPGDREDRREKYRSLKIAYFTENLDLTPQEAEKFWPLYNEYQKNKGELFKSKGLRSRGFAQKMDEISEEEAEEIIDRHMEVRQKEISLDMKFHKDLKEVLPSKKIMKVYITEVEFREYMLKHIRDEHRGGNSKSGRKDP